MRIERGKAGRHEPEKEGSGSSLKEDRSSNELDAGKNGRAIKEG